MNAQPRIALAALIGVVSAFALLGASVYVDELGFTSLARLLAWPNGWLQSLVPPHNVGTAAHPVMEGSPLNAVAFAASVPLGALAYGAIAWGWLRRRSRRRR